eukprot:3424673-Amphidinium_carterae.1
MMININPWDACHPGRQQWLHPQARKDPLRPPACRAMEGKHRHGSTHVEDPCSLEKQQLLASVLPKARARLAGTSRPPVTSNPFAHQGSWWGTVMLHQLQGDSTCRLALCRHAS